MPDDASPITNFGQAGDQMIGKSGGGNAFRGPQIFENDDSGMMPIIGANRVSEAVLEDYMDESARMSDMSNLTPGNHANNLQHASPNIAVKVTPF